MNKFAAIGIMGVMVTGLTIPASPALAKSKPNPHATTSSHVTSRTHKAKATYSTKRKTSRITPRKTVKRTYVRHPQIQRAPHGTTR